MQCETYDARQWMKNSLNRLGGTWCLLQLGVFSNLFKAIIRFLVVVSFMTKNQLKMYW